MTPERPLGERPLSARSIIASTLLGMSTPALAGNVLIHWTELFGIAEGTTRVALSRMLAAGELATDNGRYELSGRLRDRQAIQMWSRTPRLTEWNGRWTLYIVEDGPRPADVRRELRDAMSALRAARIRDGVWVRPDNLPADARPKHALEIATQSCLVSQTELTSLDAATAQRLWQTSQWQEAAIDHLSRMSTRLPALEAGNLSALAPTFEVAAHALTHIRRDPLLPSELLPAQWPGDELRARYADFEAAFRAAWRTWYHDHANG